MAVVSKKWLRPLKAREGHLDYIFRDWRDAQYALYHAVIEGRVRSRWNGKLLDVEVAHALSQHNWGDFYDLPPDIEVSVDDIDEEFERGLSKIRAPGIVATIDHIPKWFADTIGAAVPGRASVLPSKQQAIQQAHDALWPKGPPIGTPKKTIYDAIRNKLKQRPIQVGASTISLTADDKTIRKALKAKR